MASRAFAISPARYWSPGGIADCAGLCRARSPAAPPLVGAVVLLPLDVRDNPAHARCELARVLGQVDQLVAGIQERIADELGMQRMTGRGGRREEHEERLCADAAKVSRDLQRVAHGRPDTHQGDLTRRRLDPLEVVNAQASFLGRALDQGRMGRVGRLEQQQAMTTCSTWNTTLVARWRRVSRVIGYVAC